MASQEWISGQCTSEEVRKEKIRFYDERARGLGEKISVLVKKPAEILMETGSLSGTKPFRKKASQLIRRVRRLERRRNSLVVDR